MGVVQLESLEPRRLRSVTLSGGVLKVSATPANDVVGLRVVDGTMRVGLNAQLFKFNAAAVTAISIDLGDGADRVDIGAGVGAVYILGGLGNDTIYAGAA